jgi:hypothetical protein
MVAAVVGVVVSGRGRTDAGNIPKTDGAYAESTALVAFRRATEAGARN